MTDAPLLRPSHLARFWELHPTTVYTWIREGRLAAVRSPGAQYRLRASDVRAFCEREKLPLPLALFPKQSHVIVLGGNDGFRKGIKRALKPHGATIECFDDAYRGFIAAALDPPSAIAVDGALRDFDVEKAIGALRGTGKTEKTPIVVVNVAFAAKRDAFLHAGASSVFSRAHDAEALRALIAFIAP